MKTATNKQTKIHRTCRCTHTGAHDLMTSIHYAFVELVHNFRRIGEKEKRKTKVKEGTAFGKHVI